MSGALKGELEALTGAYYEEAPEDAAYPYMVFSARRLTEDAGQQVYTLEVNAWDQHPYYSRAEGMMDVREVAPVQLYDRGASDKDIQGGAPEHPGFGQDNQAGAGAVRDARL